ncbi:lipopolysaccharide biosynthesis protein [Deinococcus sp. 12RED42]|uniref:lipopolysaccharide biosynthesis protein n=1 Tax=Deinococcus sp. 12RED42 TaxID=2745872 RepID=UPI001E525892|nr:lipopolysaccharide biosynthesis protein [Deinococcus sp. 12RED42]MCD0164624.1 lipopolysaccharide biosynthesis protein [Deinococcus sp. 12RED42]
MTLSSHAAKNSVMMVARLVMSQGANFLVGVMIARKFSIEDYGKYSLLIAINAILLVLTEFGYSYSIQKTNSHTKRPFIKRTILWSSVVSIIFAIIASVFMINKDYGIVSVLCIFLAIITMPVYNVLVAFFEAANRFNLILILDTVSSLLYALMVYVFYSSLSITMIAILILTKQLTLAFLAMLFSRLVVLSDDQQLHRLKSVGELINFGRFSYFSNILGAINGSAAPILSVTFLSTEQVGRLSFSIIIVSYLQQVFMASNRALLPFFIKSGRSSESSLVSIMRMYIIVSILAIVTFKIFGLAVIEVVFGEQWKIAYQPILWLLFGNLITSSTIPGVAFLLSKGLSRELFLYTAFRTTLFWIIMPVVLLVFKNIDSYIVSAVVLEICGIYVIYNVIARSEIKFFDIYLIPICMATCSVLAIFIFDGIWNGVFSYILCTTAIICALYIEFRKFKGGLKE